MSNTPNKITPDFLQSEITSIEYRRLTGTMTHCTVTVINGFTFTGESACADPSNYDKELGEKIALENAKSKMWVPYGFLLKEHLHRAIEAHEKCTAPQDPDHELTADEAAHPVKQGDRVDFGTALHLMELGERMQRSGWNGKGMFVYIVPAASYPAQRNTKGVLVGDYLDDMVPYAAYIALKTANGEVVPWTISQSDALAADWQLA